MSDFDKNKHPRDSDGKFTNSNSHSSAWDNMSAAEMKKQLQKDVSSDETIVKVNLDAEIQKQFDNATPKERQKLAYRYIMDNLAGKYTALDGREVSISSVGADKITHRNIDVKLRVSPELAALIKTGKLESVVDIEHKRFVKMAYYKAKFQIGYDVYVGLLNVGIRSNGESTLYDLNPFNKQ